MANTAKKLIDIALAEVGYLEKASNSQLDSKTANAGRNNFTKYARDLDAISGFYNGKKNGFAWCDVFVDWCFVRAFGVAAAKKLLNQPAKSLGAGCQFSAKYYKQAGRLHTDKPQVGDQIFFGTSADNVTHTGLVYKVDSKKVYTVEGNTSSTSGVVANGGGVFKKSYSLTYSKIYAYGRPAYDDEKPAAPTNTKPAPADYRNSAYSKSYVVTASALNMRRDAGTANAITKVLENGDKVRCYGYYSKDKDGGIWLYVMDAKGAEGYCSKAYLK